MGALCGMLQSLRLWNRAIDALSRLAPPTSVAPKSTEENPFEVSSDADQDRDQTAPVAARSKATPTPTDALSWRLLSHLVSTLFSLAHAYHVRGSPREALYFVQQVLDLAESTGAPAVVARACILRGEVLLGQGALGEAREALERAGCLLGGVLGIDAADAQRLKGDYGVQVGGEERDRNPGREEGSPRAHYERAWKMLDELERMIVSFDGGCVSFVFFVSDEADALGVGDGGRASSWCRWARWYMVDRVWSYPGSCLLFFVDTVSCAVVF